MFYLNGALNAILADWQCNRVDYKHSTGVYFWVYLFLSCGGVGS